jgi:hypothetical protein
MKLRFGIILSVTALSMLVMGLGTASAQTTPDSSEVGTVTASNVSTMADCIGPISPDGGAGACFQPYGEHLFNCDLLADGHHPVARYYRSTSPNTLRMISDAPTAGNCVDHNLADIPEDGWIKLQSCNYEQSTLLTCSAFWTISARG